MKKIVLSNSLFFVLLASMLLCFVAVMSCGSNGDPSDSGDEYADSADTTGEEAEDPDAPCIDCDGNMLDADSGMDASTETTDDYAEVSEIPAEYLFIEGTWKRTECDGGPCKDEVILDFEIESWDDNLGAKILELAPFDSIYLKKNAETGQFEFGNPEDEDFGLTSGNADSALLKIVTTHYPLTNPNETHTRVWEKLE